MHGDSRAFGRERGGDGGTGTASPTGDEHDLAGESQVHGAQARPRSSSTARAARRSRVAGCLASAHVLGVLATVRRGELLVGCLRRRIGLEGGLQLGRHLERGRS